MGSAIYFTALKPPDETWEKHKTVWDACANAGVSVPDETQKYFGYLRPDHYGVAVDLGSFEHSEHKSMEYIDGESGVAIDISKLPEGTRYIKARWG